MVANLEKIKLITKERVVNTSNPFNERSTDYISDNIFIFEKGKIYGIICEHGGGGEAISLLLSNQLSRKEEKIYFDNAEADMMDVKQAGWYVGKVLYSENLIRKEMSIKKALKCAIKKYQKYENIDDIIDEFALSPDRLDYSLSKNCNWERWRASLAIGYASNKTVFCFPWMNTLEFYDCLYNSSVFRFFKKLRNEGAIIILPTSRKENVAGIADEIIQICSPRFEHVISDSQYFKECF